MNTKLIGIVLLVLSFVFGQSFDTHKLERDESAQYALKADGKLNIKNKYGYIHVKTWDKQETTINVHIKVDGRNEKKAQEIMDRINIKFSNTGNDVYAETVLGDSDGSNNNWNYNTSFTINYEVMMPKNAFLNIYNKYGNTEIMALNRSINAEIKYGNITIGELKGDLNLTLGYGNANFESVHKFSGEIKYSEINLANADDVDLDTKYSKLNMQNVGNMKIESKYDTYRITSAKSIQNEGKYDDFQIGEVGSLRIVSKYTDVDVQLLSEMFSIDQRYGEVDIAELGANVKSITIDAQYMDCDIHKTNAGYSVDFTSDYSDLRYPDGLEVTHKDFEGTEKELIGQYGNGQTKINVSMRYGAFKIR